jgi:pSer/pThr/pTyr-binding forkhead associated (FHA) protein
MYQLALLVDDVVIKLFLLNKSRITIGRGADNDIQVEDSGVSTKHACIRVVPSKLLEGHEDIFFEDFGSRNGSLVNDEPVIHCQLKPNDVITIAWNQFKVIDTLGLDNGTTAYILLD